MVPSIPQVKGISLEQAPDVDHSHRTAHSIRSTRENDTNLETWEQDEYHLLIE